MRQTCEKQNEEKIDELIQQLRSHSAVTRVSAREHLAAIGSPATLRLTELLKDPLQHVRWEAARTLVEIADPQAAAPLIEAMDDEDEDVRWVAAEAVIALRDAAIRPVLRALVDRNESVPFYQSAHHVLSGLADVCRCPELFHVRAALRDEEPGAEVPVAAEEALEQLDRS